MPRGYWRVILAIVGIIAIICALTAGYHILDRAEKQPYSDYKYQPARDARLPETMEDSKVAAESYQPSCQAPKTQSDADLCAQWAAVQAVQESNRLARLSMRVTAVEIGAIVITIMFTAWAAFAAAGAAKAAHDSIKSFRRAEGAFMAPTIKKINEAVYDLTATNVGKTSAIVIHADYGIFTEKMKIAVPINLTGHFGHSVMVPSEKQYKFGPFELPATCPPTEFFVYGGILYEDIFQESFVTIIAFCVNRISNSVEVIYDADGSKWSELTKRK